MYVHTYIYIYRWSVGAAKWVSRREQRAAEAEELFQLLRGRRGVSVLRGTTCKTIDNTLVTLLPTGIRRWVAVLPVIMWLLRSWALVQLPPKSVSVGFHRAFKCRSSNRICATISAVPWHDLSLSLSLSLSIYIYIYIYTHTHTSFSLPLRPLFQRE